MDSSHHAALHHGLGIWKLHTQTNIHSNINSSQVLSTNSFYSIKHLWCLYIFNLLNHSCSVDLILMCCFRFEMCSSKGQNASRTSLISRYCSCHNAHPCVIPAEITSLWELCLTVRMFFPPRRWQDSQKDVRDVEVFLISNCSRTKTTWHISVQAKKKIWGL